MDWPFTTNRRDQVCGSPQPQAERDAALSRLWDATRPVEPDDPAWDALWCRVRDRLDSSEPSAETTLTLPARPWRRTAVTALLLAQAAGLLAAAVLWSVPRHSTQVSVVKTIPVPVPTPMPTPAPIQVARDTIDIVQGQTVMIHLDGATARAEAVLPAEGPSNDLAGFVEVEDFYVMFNKFEAGLETQLAQND